MLKVKEPYKALPVNGADNDWDPELFLLRLKTAVQLSFSSDVNNPGKTEDVPVESKKTFCRNS
jgi:hypothetical protein